MKHAIILAAGKGTRMHSDLPKCAHLVLGKPMINHVVDACKESGIDDIVVVVGYKREVIMDLLKKETKVRFAFQDDQLGTGHAVKCTKELLEREEGDTVILPGDMPLIGNVNITKLMEEQKKNHNAMTILTAIFDNPFSYGRIVRINNNVVGIVEEKEATESNEKPDFSDQNIDCQENKKRLILSDNLINVKTTKTSKTKTPNKKERKQLFLDSYIDLLNYILDEYEIQEKLSYIDFAILLKQYSYNQIKNSRLWEIITISCPKNKELLFSGIEKEMKIENKKFEILVSINFKKLYKYFKTDDDVIIKGSNIIDLNGLFKTLKDYS